MIKKLTCSLYVQVLLAITAGVLLGHCAPGTAIQMQPLGEGFIRLIKLTIAPVVFCTVVSGLAGLQNLKKVGRVSGKALLYFEAVSTLALVIGLLAAHGLQPGAGFNVDPASLDARAVALTQPTQPMGGWLAHVIPDTFVGAFASGNMLHVLLIAALFGVALAALGEQVRGVARGIDKLSQVFFKLVRFITQAAPIGAFGAMAFSIGQYGLASLVPQLKLIGAFCLVSALFVLIVFGAIATAVGFNLFRFLAYLKEELLIVLSTSSSEAALPRLMQKLEQLGCARSVVGLVVPAGYTCNLDGTNLYLTMAVLFIAQATNTDLTLAQQLALLAVAMLTSKGASGVAGAGFITLAATLAVVPTVPLSGMVLILGIDRFMSDIRALTNLIGNGIAAIVICAWEKELDYARLKQVIGPASPPCLNSALYMNRSDLTMTTSSSQQAQALHGVPSILTDCIDQSPYMAHLTDASTGEYLYFNMLWADKLRVASPEAILGLTTHDLAEQAVQWQLGDGFMRWQRGWAERIKSRDEEVIHTQRPTHKVHLLFTAEGSILWENLIKIPIFSRDDKKVVAILSYNEDITLHRSLPELFELYQAYYADEHSIRYLSTYLGIRPYFEQSAFPTCEEMRALLLTQQNAPLFDTADHAHLHRLQEKVGPAHWPDLLTRLRVHPSAKSYVL